MSLSEINTKVQKLDASETLVQSCPVCHDDVFVVQSIHGAWSQAFDVDASDDGGFAIWEHDDDASDTSIMLYRQLSPTRKAGAALDDETRHHAHSCAPTMREVRERNAANEPNAREWASIRERTLEAVARSMGMTLAPAHDDDDAHAFDLVFSDDDAPMLMDDDAGELREMGDDAI